MELVQPTMVIQVMLAITRDRGAKMKEHKIDGVYRHSMQQSQGLKWGSMPYRLVKVGAMAIPSRKGERNAFGTYRFVFSCKLKL